MGLKGGNNTSENTDYQHKHSQNQNTVPDLPDAQNTEERRVKRTVLNDLHELYQKPGDPLQPLIQQRTRLAWEQTHYLRHPFPQIQNRAPGQPHTRNITIGKTVQNQRHEKRDYELQPRELCRHILTNGETGAGKTNLHYQLLSQLHQNDTPFLAFDLKQDYRHLLNTERFKDDLIVIPWEQLPLNPLQPPKAMEKERRWMLKFVDIFGHTQHLLDASKSFLLQKLNEASRPRNLDDDQEHPTLFDLQGQIRREETDSYKRKQYRDTVHNRLRMLTFAGETMFRNQASIPLETLLNNNVVIELDGLNARTQALVIETLLVKIFLHRKHLNQRGNGLRHVFLIDEAKNVLNQKKETDNPSEISTVTEAVAQLREFGEGIIAADQEATKLAESLFSNTATKIMLPTSSNTQFQKMAASIGLKEEQREWARQQLETGTAIVYNRKTGLAPVQIPLYTDSRGNELSKTVTDDQVQKTVEKHLTTA
jgi:type IV secretory pathway VirB4 component